MMTRRRRLLLLVAIIGLVGILFESVESFVVETTTTTTSRYLAPSTLFSAKWTVYVDQSKPSLDKGAAATLDAFLGLAPPQSVIVHPALFMDKKKTKGPAVRCICSDNNNNKRQQQQSFNVANVDSVDKVFRVLNTHMQVSGLSTKVCECLKWKFEGNGHLEAGNVSRAIDCYDKALELKVSEQEGILLLMRATAYLQRAVSHRERLKEIVKELTAMVPNGESLQSMYQQTSAHPALANAIFRRILDDSRAQEKKFRTTQYRHGLFQFALLQAAQDSLKATQLLPNYPSSWRRAAEILSELWKLRESVQYYQRAVELDPNLAVSLNPILDQLSDRQVLLDQTRAYYGWSEDTLRLALDVAR